MVPDTSCQLSNKFSCNLQHKAATCRRTQQMEACKTQTLFEISSLTSNEEARSARTRMIIDEILWTVDNYIFSGIVSGGGDDFGGSIEAVLALALVEVLALVVLAMAIWWYADGVGLSAVAKTAQKFNNENFFLTFLLQVLFNIKRDTVASTRLTTGKLPGKLPLLSSRGTVWSFHTGRVASFFDDSEFGDDKSTKSTEATGEFAITGAVEGQHPKSICWTIHTQRKVPNIDAQLIHSLSDLYDTLWSRDYQGTYNSLQLTNSSSLYHKLVTTHQRALLFQTF
uniref:Uncharacterized protein n=1 Tax=Glossina brevipalpis TaxID=37001 RepID=A0A1A9WIZ1_9MUSC